MPASPEQMHVLAIGDGLPMVWYISGRERLQRQVRELAKSHNLVWCDDAAALLDTAAPDAKVLVLNASYLYDKQTLQGT